MSYLDTLRDELARARRAFKQNPTPALSSAIGRIQREIANQQLYWVQVAYPDGSTAALCGYIRGVGSVTEVSRSTAYRWAAAYRREHGGACKVLRKGA